MKRDIIIILLVFIGACKSIESGKPTLEMNFSNEEKQLADSLLTLALDNEALYTIVEPIKPISTVLNFSLPIARADSIPSGVREATNLNGDALKKLTQLQHVVNRLQFGDVQFLLIPFKRAEKGKRYFEVVAVNTKALQKVIARDQPFWAQWGFVPNANPAVILTTNEFEERLDRYRGYGYLFGYPEHAITFFVEAARQEDSTKQFVKRDFFQIPVFSSETGHFTYAIPKGYTPTEIDSALYRRATATLQRYKATRQKFISQDGRLRATELLQEMLKK
ncbi:MAG: hypothetical protein SNJ55_04835 [Chloroherpetonaceae bacterium]